MGFFDPFGGSGGTIVPGNYATTAELNSEAEKRASADKELQNEIKTNTESISNLVAGIESVNQSVSGLENSVEELQTNKANAADVYNKDETDNAITAKVAEIVAGAPEEFDTLKEMSDWLTEHEDSAATMNTAILKNKEDIATNATAIEENTADIEQNKSDILSLENNKLNLNFGYVYSGHKGNTGWKRLAHCEWSPTDTGEFRDTTLYIEKMGNDGSVEYEGLLKFILRASKNGDVYSCNRVDGYALINKGLDTNEIVMVAKVEGTMIIAEIWCKISYLYTGYRATMISATTRGVTVNFGTPTHWSLDKASTSVLAQESYPNWEKKATITDYYGDIIKGLSDRITALENK